MAAEAYHLVLYGMFETDDDADRDNHHSQTDSHPNGSYTNGRAADFTMVAVVGINPFGKKKRQIHSVRPG